MKNLETIKLWPHSLKKWSYILIITGVSFLLLYFKGIRPAWANVKIFAVVSTYLENRYLQIVQTNLMDEFGVFSLIVGLGLMIFTKERHETLEYNLYRLRAFLFAAKFSLASCLIAYAMLFGFIIFPISMMIFAVFLIVYYAYFRYLIRTK
jgi:hypothetical protein